MIVNILTASGTQKLWKAERIMFYGQGVQEFSHPVKMWTNLHGSNTSPIATYTPTSSNELYVDLTDYVRTYPTVSHVYFNSAYFEDTADISVSVVGLINPSNVIIPPHWQYAKIVPPNYMIAGTSGQVIAEFYDFDEASYMTSGATWVNSHRGLSPTGGAFDIYRSMQGSQAQRKQYTLRQQRCGVQYALVEWVSFTGTQRRHIFEVIKAKTETADAFSLMPIDNEYIEIKGRKDGLSLRLDGLCAYDLWYYSDLITSSNVKVSLDGTNWDRVQVTTKSITQPDGEGGDGELEIAINWKRYDAVAM